MSHAHTSHHHAAVIDSGKVASHLENSVTQLSGSNSIVEIDIVDASHTERSVFYRDDGKRVYQINPKEHPALTGALDSLLGRIACKYGIPIERTNATDAYIIAVTDTCDDCTLDDPSSTPLDDDDAYYPPSVTEKLTSCPFDGMDMTCSEATGEETACVHTGCGTHVTDADAAELAEFTTHPVPNTDTSPEPTLDVLADVNCTGMTIAQDGVDPILAKLIGVLDVIAFVRTHPSITSSALDHYPSVIDDAETNVTPEKFTRFKDHCDDFLLETAPGWRLRWILEVVEDDPKPLENIAAAANIPLVEAQLTVRLLEEWDIVDRTEELTEHRYQLSDAYVAWRDSIDESGVENTEPAYLTETGDPVELIEQSYQALTATSY